MEFTAQKIAELLGGKIDGNPEITVNTLSKIEEGKTGSLSFLANPKYTPFIYETQASIVIVNEDFKPEANIRCTLIRVKDAYSSFAKLLKVYDQIKSEKSGISKKASIAESAETGKNVYIGDFVYIGENVVIGDNVKIHPHTFIGDRTIIGKNTILYAGVRIYCDNLIGSDCTLHAGAIIGSDGFGFAPNVNNQYDKVSQIGNVIIEDHVEIGANTTIDRATLGSTIIRKGVKLDNLIQIAHNVEIGQNTVMAAQSGVAGSTKVGKNCMIGGQVGISGHLTLGDNVKIAAQSGISGNVKDNEILIGSPAFDIRKYRKAYIHFKNFAKIIKRLEALENQQDKK